MNEIGNITKAMQGDNPKTPDLENWLKQQVECGEPSSTGSWYCLERDSFPFSILQFHFEDNGKLTGVKITDYDELRVFAEYSEENNDSATE